MLKLYEEPYHEMLEDLLQWPEEQPQHLLFSVNTEAFGVELLAVKEVLKFSKPLSIPDMPPYVAGIFNYSGEIIPFFDLRIMFGRTVSQSTEATAVIIVQQEETLFGLIVDEILDVSTLRKHAPDVLQKDKLALDNGFIHNTIDLGSHKIAMIDLDTILTFVQTGVSQ